MASTVFAGGIAVFSLAIIAGIIIMYTQKKTTRIDRWRCNTNKTCSSRQCDETDELCATEFPYTSKQDCINTCSLTPFDSTRYYCDKSGKCQTKKCKSTDDECIRTSFATLDECKKRCVSDLMINRWKCNPSTSECVSKLCRIDDSQCRSEYPYTSKKECEDACIKPLFREVYYCRDGKCNKKTCAAQDSECLVNTYMTPDCNNNCMQQLTVSGWRCNPETNICESKTCLSEDQECINTLMGYPYRSLSECQSNCIQPLSKTQWQCDPETMKCKSATCSVTDKSCIEKLNASFPHTSKEQCESACLRSISRTKWKCDSSNKQCTSKTCDVSDSQCMNELSSYPFINRAECLTGCMETLTQTKWKCQSGECQSKTCNVSDVECMSTIKEYPYVSKEQCIPSCMLQPLLPVTVYYCEDGQCKSRECTADNPQCFENTTRSPDCDLSTWTTLYRNNVLELRKKVDSLWTAKQLSIIKPILDQMFTLQGFDGTQIETADSLRVWARYGVAMLSAKFMYNAAERENCWVEDINDYDISKCSSTTVKEFIRSKLGSSKDVSDRINNMADIFFRGDINTFNIAKNREKVLNWVNSCGNSVKYHLRAPYAKYRI